MKNLFFVVSIFLLLWTLSFTGAAQEITSDGTRLLRFQLFPMTASLLPMPTICGLFPAQVEKRDSLRRIREQNLSRTSRLTENGLLYSAIRRRL
jgi:hypothetical protein